MFMSNISKTALTSELLAATDAEIEDAVNYAEPMALRGVIHQLTGDSELQQFETQRVMTGYFLKLGLANDADLALLRRKAADFLKSYRDSGAGPIPIRSPERLRTSLELMRCEHISDDQFKMYIEEMGLNPTSRELQWREKPDPERLGNFRVVVIGAGMGGLTAAMQLKKAGIDFKVIEKNVGVGGTWHENRYPGCRTDSLIRSYTNTFGVDFPYPYAYCPWDIQQRYYDWVADSNDVRKNIEFETEVHSLTWDEAAGEWEIGITEKSGAKRTERATVVMTAVGFLNRPNLPNIEGHETFKGQSWHTARWPEGVNLKDKRVAVIGTGCSGYQLSAELALEVKELTIFQRTASWLFPSRGYRSPYPPQINWLDRNLPYYTNFLRLGTSAADGYTNLTSIDPNFHDPHSTSETNKRARDLAMEFLESKLKDHPRLLDAMIPRQPVWSARPVAVDPEWSVLDAIKQDHVTLETNGIRRINETGIETEDGRQLDFDVIVFATGFHATDYLMPMTVTGRNGLTTEALWADEGARAYRGCMIPGFPNLFTIYGPNTNGGLPPATFHEMIVFYALRCMENLILDDKKSVEVLPEPYREYNELIDKRNAVRTWADPRSHSYYWSKYGRSVTQNPLRNTEMWPLMHYIDYDHLKFD